MAQTVWAPIFGVPRALGVAAPMGAPAASAPEYKGPILVKDLEAQAAPVSGAPARLAAKAGLSNLIPIEEYQARLEGSKTAAPASAPLASRLVPIAEYRAQMAAAERGERLGAPVPTAASADEDTDDEDNDDGQPRAPRPLMGQPVSTLRSRLIPIAEYQARMGADVSDASDREDKPLASRLIPIAEYQAKLDAAAEAPAERRPLASRLVPIGEYMKQLESNGQAALAAPRLGKCHGGHGTGARHTKYTNLVALSPEERLSAAAAHFAAQQGASEATQQQFAEALVTEVPESLAHAHDEEELNSMLSATWAALDGEHYGFLGIGKAFKKWKAKKKAKKAEKKGKYESLADLSPEEHLSAAAARFAAQNGAHEDEQEHFASALLEAVPEALEHTHDDEELASMLDAAWTAYDAQVGGAHYEGILDGLTGAIKGWKQGRKKAKAKRAAEKAAKAQAKAANAEARTSGAVNPRWASDVSRPLASQLEGTLVKAMAPEEANAYFGKGVLARVGGAVKDAAKKVAKKVGAEAKSAVMRGVQKHLGLQPGGYYKFDSTDVKYAPMMKPLVDLLEQGRLSMRTPDERSAAGIDEERTARINSLRGPVLSLRFLDDKQRWTPEDGKNAGLSQWKFPFAAGGAFDAWKDFVAWEFSVEDARRSAYRRDMFFAANGNGRVFELAVKVPDAPEVAFKFTAQFGDRGTASTHLWVSGGDEGKVPPMVFCFAKNGTLEAITMKIPTAAAGIFEAAAANFAALLAEALATPVTKRMAETALQALCAERYESADASLRACSTNQVLATFLAAHLIPALGAAKFAVLAQERVTLLDPQSKESLPAPLTGAQRDFAERFRASLNAIGELAADMTPAEVQEAARTLQAATEPVFSEQRHGVTALVSQALHANATRVVNHRDGLDRMKLLWESGVSALDSAFS